MSEKRSAGTTYGDHDSHRERDTHPGWDSRQQRAGLAAAEDVMSRWTGAFYDYAEQLLKSQRQFARRVLSASAPMGDIARDVMSSDTHEGRSGNKMDATSDQHHESFTRSRKDECSNGDTADYNKHIDSDMSGHDTSDTSRTERVNTHTDESAKLRGRGAASDTRKLP